MDTSHLHGVCARVGLVMTGQRGAILRALAGLGDHPSIQEIAGEAKQHSPRITLATVYRTMKKLEDAGAIRQIDFGEGFVRFEATGKEPHFHLIDAETGKVVEFHDFAIEQKLRALAAELGFYPISTELTLVARALPEALPAAPSEPRRP